LLCEEKIKEVCEKGTSTASSGLQMPVSSGTPVMNYKSVSLTHVITKCFYTLNIQTAANRGLENTGKSETNVTHLSQYLTNLMHKICFTISFISCLYMFRAHVLIITPIGVMIPEAV